MLDAKKEFFFLKIILFLFCLIFRVYTDKKNILGAWHVTKLPSAESQATGAAVI